MQLLAVETEGEAAFLVSLVRIAFRLPGPAIPQQNGAAAVLAFGDGAFEIAVIERMILDMDREALLAFDEARPLRHRPAFEDAVELKAEIVVQAGGVVLLDDEGRPPMPGGLACRLGGFREVALGAIGCELCHDVESNPRPASGSSLKRLGAGLPPRPCRARSGTPPRSGRGYIPPAACRRSPRHCRAPPPCRSS